jgi:hypothetical protein
LRGARRATVCVCIRALDVDARICRCAGALLTSGGARPLIHYGVPVNYPLVLALPQSDDRIVLTDYMDATPDHGNLARIRKDGTDVWRVTPATQSQDAWTVARLDGDVCRASAWSGWDVTLDLATGRERSRVFTK